MDGGDQQRDRRGSVEQREAEGQSLTPVRRHVVQQHRQQNVARIGTSSKQKANGSCVWTFSTPPSQIRIGTMGKYGKCTAWLSNSGCALRTELVRSMDPKKTSPNPPCKTSATALTSSRPRQEPGMIFAQATELGS